MTSITIIQDVVPVEPEQSNPTYAELPRLIRRDKNGVMGLHEGAGGFRGAAGRANERVSYTFSVKGGVYPPG